MNEKHIIINQALDNIFASIKMLRQAFPGKEFTIDGRLVGDLGETFAALYYDIELYPISQPCHDGECSDGRKVQVKATFKDSLTFGKLPDYYLGLQLFPDGHFQEIYNGPGQKIYDHYQHRSGIGKNLLSFPIPSLQMLSSQVPPSERIGKRGE